MAASSQLESFGPIWSSASEASLCTPAPGRQMPDVCRVAQVHHLGPLRGAGGSPASPHPAPPHPAPAKPLLATTGERSAASLGLGARQPRSGDLGLRLPGSGTALPAPQSCGSRPLSAAALFSLGATPSSPLLKIGGLAFKKPSASPPLPPPKKF